MRKLDFKGFPGHHGAVIRKSIAGQVVAGQMIAGRWRQQLGATTHLRAGLCRPPTFRVGRGAIPGLTGKSTCALLRPIVAHRPYFPRS